MSLAALLVLPTAVSALAQGAAPGADAFHGPALESPGGDVRVQLGLLLQGDFKFTLNDGDGQDVDAFVLRRVRPSLRAQVGHRFEFFLNPDFSTTSTVVVQDLYVDAVFTPAFRLRVGKEKTPFGLERLQSALNLLFLERAMPTAIAPNRDIGIQALGDLRGGVFSYLAAVTNGAEDGGSYEHHPADGKDVSGRIIVRPFTTRKTHPLQGLSLAMSGSAGDHSRTALRSFRTQTSLQRYFSYASGVINDGTRTRYSPQVSYYQGRFGGFGEYVHSQAPLRRADVREDIGHQAWQVAGSWVLTGEAATDAISGVQPRADFDLRAGHWGALQVAARYHTLHVDNEASRLGLVAAGSSSRAFAWTLGVNWYLTGNVRCTSNFERTVFNGDSPNARPPENLLAFRTQLVF